MSQSIWTNTLFKKKPERIFKIVTAVKIAVIPVITGLFLYIALWFFLKINLVTFNANGLFDVVALEDAYYEYIFSQSYNLSPYIILFEIIALFLGYYLSTLLLRPFKMIGDYCGDSIDGKEVIYDPDFFTDLKILTQFSEYFFNIIESAKKNQKLEQVIIPSKFARVRGPVFEGTFFLQYFLIILIVAIIGAVLVHQFIFSIYSGLIDISLESIGQNSLLRQILTDQESLLDTLYYGTIVIYTVLYISMSINLYSNVAAPAFGIFATMRSFLKGKYSNRVHFLGFSYIRNDSRRLNKFLDEIAQELTNK